MEWRGGMVPHVGLKVKSLNKVTRVENDSITFRENISQWNQYRGPNRDGHIPQQGVAINWQEKPKTLWQVPVGEGHSSVLVDQETIFSLEQNGENETLFARDLSNGQEKWKFALNTKWNDMMSGTGPRSTPTLINGKVYSLFSNGILCRIDAWSGNLDWQTKTVDADYEFPEWGISCSPLIWNNLIILNLGGDRGAVRAYSIHEGKLVWESVISGKGVYLSSDVYTILGANHLIAAVEGKIFGLDPNTGKTIWERPWKIFLNNVQIAQPIATPDHSVILAAGYGKGAECWTFTRDSNGKYLIQTAWKSKNLKAKFSNPVLKDGYIYGLSENLLVCIDARSGELKWRGKKYGYGRVLVSDDKLIILGNTGVLSVVEASPGKFTEILSEQLLSNGRCWNGPALVGGYLIAMNGRELACFDWAK